jgi:hypothetical protein
MIRGLRAKLATALSERTLVRVEREIDEGWCDAYVVALGDGWVLLAVVGHGIRPNGYEAIRLRDITKFLERAPHATFVEAALARKKIKRPEPLNIDITDAASILGGVPQYPLVSIHREVADAEVCHIGRVSSLTKKSVFLLEVTPDATWEAEPTPYALSEITKIGFGDPYSEALALVNAAPRERVRSSDQW